MGSYRIGIGFKTCINCDNPKCIVDVWDRDYDGIRESHYCSKCNPKSTAEFIKGYINGKIQSRAYNLMNTINAENKATDEENVAKTLISLMRFDYNNYENIDLFNKMKDVKEFNIEQVFDFKKVRELVRKNLMEDET